MHRKTKKGPCKERLYLVRFNLSRMIQDDRKLLAKRSFERLPLAKTREFFFNIGIVARTNSHK